MAKFAPTVDEVFRALADPSRRLMVERLSRGPASVSDIAEPLPMSMPSVMQHLQLLERSGLVHSRKAGRVRTYQINIDAMRPAEQWMSARRAGWEHRLDRLGAHLQTVPVEPRDQS